MEQDFFSSIPQKYWNQGLKYLNEGDDAPTAIQKLYSYWMPPFSLSGLATVIGALYADSYWAKNKDEGQRMSATDLANDLSAAIGVNLPDAQRAAQSAFSRWYGLFARANLTNSGEIPKQGDLTQSPDVLVNRTATLSPDFIITNWNQAHWGPATGLKNYAYGRAQSLNIGVTINQPTLRMYYSTAGFLPPPSSWNQLFTTDGSLEQSPLVDINSKPVLPPGTRAASSLAFTTTFPGTGHYCIIASAATEFFPNRPDAGEGNWDSATWLQNNGGAGWHNVDVSTLGEAKLKFYNRDSQPERFVFEAHCYGLQNGSKVSLAADGLLKQTQATISRPYQLVSAELVAPANHVGDLAVTFGKLPQGGSVTFRKYWVLPAGHQHHHHAARQMGDVSAAIAGTPVRMPLGDFTFVGDGG